MIRGSAAVVVRGRAVVIRDRGRGDRGRRRGIRMLMMVSTFQVCCVDFVSCDGQSYLSNRCTEEWCCLFFVWIF